MNTIFKQIILYMLLIVYSYKGGETMDEGNSTLSNVRSRYCFFKAKGI